MLPEKKPGFLIALCFIGIFASLGYCLIGDIRELDVAAPVHVNIEIDKRFAKNISFEAVLSGNKTVFYPSTTMPDTSPTVVLYSEIKTNYRHSPRVKEKNYVSFLDKISIRVLGENPAETLNALHGISLFIGDKLFYFSRYDMASITKETKDGYALFRLPVPSAKSFLGARPLNWYGDFNLIMQLFLNPLNFWPVWLFVLFLIFLYNRGAVSFTGSKKTEAAFLVFIVLVAFLLRYNAYPTSSAFADELYSVTIASNPNVPFINTMNDPGNPPLYFILLRFWFMIFGWSEASGRMLSMLIGSFTVVPLYFLTRRFGGVKAAFLAATFLTVSAYAISLSHTMRGYGLELFLVPLVALSFLIFMKNPSVKNIILYTLAAACIANTHYYGVLFVVVNFIFFTIVCIRDDLGFKRWFLFLFANVIAAASFLPFFIHTAFNKALADPNFNSHISSMGVRIYLFLFLAISTLAFYIYIRRKNISKYLTNEQFVFTDYTVFVSFIIFALAFIFSLYRTVLVMKYYRAVVFALIVIFISIVLVNVFSKTKSQSVKIICAFIVFSSFLILNSERYAETDITREALFYVDSDIKTYKDVNAALMMLYANSTPAFYNLSIPSYGKYGKYGKAAWDVVYLVPSYEKMDELYTKLDRYGFNSKTVLRININASKAVLKVLLKAEQR